MSELTSDWLLQAPERTLRPNRNNQWVRRSVSSLATTSQAVTWKKAHLTSLFLGFSPVKGEGWSRWPPTSEDCTFASHLLKISVLSFGKSSFGSSPKDGNHISPLFVLSVVVLLLLDLSLFLHSFTLPITPCTVPEACFYRERGPFSKSHTDVGFLATTLLISCLLPISDHYLLFIFLFGGMCVKRILFSLCVFFMCINGIALLLFYVLSQRSGGTWTHP